MLVARTREKFCCVPTAYRRRIAIRSANITVGAAGGYSLSNDD